MPKLLFLLISSILTLIALIIVVLLKVAPSQTMKVQTLEPTDTPMSPLSYVCECKGQDKDGTRLKKNKKFSLNYINWSWRSREPWTVKDCEEYNKKPCDSPGYYYWSGRQAKECTYYGCKLK